MEIVVQIIKIIPAVAAIWLGYYLLNCFGAEIRRLLEALAARVRTAEKIKVGDALTVEGVVAMVEAATVSADQAAHIALSKAEPAGTTTGAITSELRALAEEYEAANQLQPRTARVRRKDELAAQMVYEVHRGKVSREALSASAHVGFGVALAE